MPVYSEEQDIRFCPKCGKGISLRVNPRHDDLHEDIINSTFTRTITRDEQGRRIAKGKCKLCGMSSITYLAEGEVP